MSDSGKILEPPMPHPCSRVWLRDLTWFVGETSRPVSMGITAVATALGFLLKSEPIALGVMATLLGGMFGVKGWEGATKTKADAEVKKAGG
jgi:hypothetical protein